MNPFRVSKEGLLLSIRLTPRAARDGIDGVVAARVHARVRAVPEDASGQTARLKTVLVSGDGRALEARVSAWLKGFE